MFSVQLYLQGEQQEIVSLKPQLGGIHTSESRGKPYRSCSVACLENKLLGRLGLRTFPVNTPNKPYNTVLCNPVQGV